MTVNEAGCGYIVAVPKLKSSATNDIFSSDPKAEIPIPELTFPPSLISLSVKPKNQSQEDKLAAGIHRLSNEDPTFRVQWDKQTKETIISGMGGLHLDIMVKRLQDRFSVEVEMGTPRVPYKETIRKPVKIQGKYKKQSGGKGQYAHIEFRLEPNPGGGIEFVNRIVGGHIPKEYIPGVEKGFRDSAKKGLLADFPTNKLVDTIPEFHNTLKRYQTFLQILQANTHDRAGEVPGGTLHLRKEHQLIGEGCDKMMDACLMFGWAADYYERNGLGRVITGHADRRTWR